MACYTGVEWYKKQKKHSLDLIVLSLIKENRLEWANWLLCHVFTKRQAVQIAVFSAEQVIGIFEKKYPEDDRPRKAIESARLVLGTKYATAPRAAASAAVSAARVAAKASARAAVMAALAAAQASMAACCAVTGEDTGSFTRDVSMSALVSTVTAVSAARGQKKSFILKIIRYGCFLLKFEKKVMKELEAIK